MNNEQLVEPIEKQAFSSKIVFALSILIIFVAAILVILAIIGYTQDNKQQEAIDNQTEKTNQLIRQNQKTSQQAANYAYCNAVLLSQYTQTLQAITIEDLNTCVLKSFPGSTATGTGGIIQNNSASSANNPVLKKNENIKQTPSNSSSTAPASPLKQMQLPTKGNSSLK